MIPGRQDRRRMRGGSAGGGRDLATADGRRPERNLRLNVERIAVEGLAPSDGEPFGIALEREIVAAAADLTTGSGRSRSVARVDSGHVRSQGGDRVQHVAATLATTIVEEIDR